MKHSPAGGLALIPVLAAFPPLNYSRNGGYKAIGDGTFPIPVVKIGHRIKVRTADLEVFLSGSVI